MPPHDQRWHQHAEQHQPGVARRPVAGRNPPQLQQPKRNRRQHRRQRHVPPNEQRHQKHGAGDPACLGSQAQHHPQRRRHPLPPAKRQRRGEHMPQDRRQSRQRLPVHTTLGPTPSRRNRPRVGHSVRHCRHPIDPRLHQSQPAWQAQCRQQPFQQVQPQHQQAEAKSQQPAHIGRPNVATAMLPDVDSPKQAPHQVAERNRAGEKRQQHQPHPRHDRPSL